MRRYLFATALFFLLSPEPFAAAAAPARTRLVDVQIVAINDFHGNLETPPDAPTIKLADGSELRQRLGGVSSLAATIKRLRAGHSNTITVSAGDLIGASPLVSAYFLDEPTIAAMNEVGLQLNAVGNHASSFCGCSAGAARNIRRARRAGLSRSTALAFPSLRRTYPTRRTTRSSPEAQSGSSAR
jgi:hypothetical protein